MVVIAALLWQQLNALSLLAVQDFVDTHVRGACKFAPEAKGHLPTSEAAKARQHSNVIRLLQTLRRLADGGCAGAGMPLGAAVLRTSLKKALVHGLLC